MPPKSNVCKAGKKSLVDQTNQRSLPDLFHQQQLRQQQDQQHREIIWLETFKQRDLVTNATNSRGHIEKNINKENTDPSMKQTVNSKPSHSSTNLKRSTDTNDEIEKPKKLKGSSG